MVLGVVVLSEESAMTAMTKLGDSMNVRIVVREPGAIPRQEGGKAQRVFERTSGKDEFPAS